MAKLPKDGIYQVETGAAETKRHGCLPALIRRRPRYLGEGKGERGRTPPLFPLFLPCPRSFLNSQFLLYFLIFPPAFLPLRIQVLPSRAPAVLPR